MEKNQQEQLLNQFYLNNASREFLKRKEICVSSPRRALALLVAGKPIYNDSETSYATTRDAVVKIVGKRELFRDFFRENRGEFESPQENSRGRSLDYGRHQTIDDSLRFLKINGSYFDSEGLDPLNLFYRQRTYIHEESLPFDAISMSSDKCVYRYDSAIRSEEVEKYEIENNLTYDGYCALLYLCSNKDLLNFRDTINRGINREAKDCLQQASSSEEVEGIHDDFMQLKAVSEFLIDKAEQETPLQETFSSIQGAMKDFEDNVQ